MPKRILIVDDDRSILRTLKRVLEKNGYTVDTAETAKEALDKLTNNHYDLALVDVILPDMKGTDLLIKAKNELNQTVKFIITGYPSAEVGAKARDLGAEAFILKPVKMPELLSIIRVFLNEGEESPYLSQEEERYTLSSVDNQVSAQAKEQT
jgi:DNA-binding response OmpR family regulator